MRKKYCPECDSKNITDGDIKNCKDCGCRWDVLGEIIFSPTNAAGRYTKQDIADIEHEMKIKLGHI